MTRGIFWLLCGAAIFYGLLCATAESAASGQPYFRENDGGFARWTKDGGK